MSNSVLGKFAFNIYGTLNPSNSPQNNSPPLGRPPSGPNNHHQRLNKLTYTFDREVNAISQLEFPILHYSQPYTHHVVVGGKNCLKLLSLNSEQNCVVHEVTLLEKTAGTGSFSTASSSAGSPSSAFASIGHKISSINTIKTSNDTVGCGQTNGVITLHKVLNSGKLVLLHKLNSHKRCVNSLDFLHNQDDANVLILGSQDGTIKLWDLRVTSSRPMMTISAGTHLDPIRSCQYSPHSSSRNGRINVLSVHDLGSLVKWDLRLSLQFSQERKWTFHSGPALSLHVHPELEYVITAGRDQKLCVWNYGDLSNNSVPASVVSTYGPIAKVRWSSYPVDDHLKDPFGNLERVPSLFKYDFACTYLNEEPTISVYNLARKYIPKEVITGEKGFQNFIWGNSPQRLRQLWTLTKENKLQGYSLDGIGGCVDISRPLDDLVPTSVSWSTMAGDLCLVNQKKDDFDLGNINHFSDNDERVGAGGIMGPQNAAPGSTSSSVGTGPAASALVGITSPLIPQYGSPINHANGTTNTSGSLINPQAGYERNGLSTSPLLVDRLESPNFEKLVPSSHNSRFYASPKPISTTSGSVSRSNTLLDINGNPVFNPPRPLLNRGMSQTTQESLVGSQSALPVQIAGNYSRKSNNAINNTTSLGSFLVPVSIELPFNDKEVFEAVATEYLIAIPDGHGIVDICQLNARLAAFNNRFRDCQVWQVLAVALEEEGMVKTFEYSATLDLVAVPHMENIGANNNNPDHEGSDLSSSNNSRSISSELDNFGSFNLNSTAPYGGTGLESGLASLPVPNPSKRSTTTFGLLGHSASSGFPDSVGSASPEKQRLGSFELLRNTSSLNLMDAINSSRGTVLSISPSAARSNVLLAGRAQLMEEMEKKGIGKDESQEDVYENAIEEDDDEGDNKLLKKPQLMPHILPTRGLKSRTSSNDSVKGMPNRPSFVGRTHVLDLDDENANIASSFSASSFLSVRSISTSPQLQAQLVSKRNSFRFQTRARLFNAPKEELNKVPEESELTRAIREDDTASMASKPTIADMVMEEKHNEQLQKPWSVSSLLEEALKYSSLQGDVVMCSTLTLLFYDRFLINSSTIDKEMCLEWLATYIEVLQRLQLFETAAHILKEAPLELKEELIQVVGQDTNLRFYCSFCSKLLVNEELKQRDPDRFGYWYCEQCSRQQSGCIYCHEPARKLNVVVSLRCGHRGHFPCLKQWFVEEQNIECPAGCSTYIDGIGDVFDRKRVI